MNPAVRSTVLGALSFATFFLTGCVMNNTQVTPQELFDTGHAESRTIEYGSYFGECFGYCHERLTISSGVVTYERFSAIEDEAYPLHSATIEDGSEAAAAVFESLNKSALLELPDTIGCPDCYDQGGEYIQYQLDVGEEAKESKRVDFEYGAEIPEVRELLGRIRSLRDRMFALMESEKADPDAGADSGQDAPDE